MFDPNASSAGFSRRSLLGTAPPLLIGLMVPAHVSAAPASPINTGELRASMRKLWEDHITWTRVYIISALAGLPDAEPAAARLLKNQDDIGNAIAPVYGSRAGSKLAALLKEHIKIASDLVLSAKAGDIASVSANQRRWLDNADQVADFLSGANPHWSRDMVRDMMQKHLGYTTTEVVSRLKSDWTADIDAYDANHLHMLMFSDMLVDGIVRQFPAKFASR